MLIKTSKNKLNPSFSAIKLMFLFGLLTPFILSSSIIDFEDHHEEPFQANPTLSLQINFLKKPNYVHIVVESETSGTNQILTYGTEKT